MKLSLPDAEFFFYHLDIPVDLFFEVRYKSDWGQRAIPLSDGSEIQLPRLTAWYGKDYNYSGIHNEAKPLPEFMETIKTMVEGYAEYKFNSVLLNLYRDGHDSIGMHRDNEKEFIEDAPIASLSLGQTRTFHLEHNKTRKITKIELNHGDLLIMGHNSQKAYRHGIPKEPKYKGERINMTFRTIQ